MKQVFNPYLPLYEYVPDGEPHVFEGRLYIYGSHDIAGGDKYCMGDYVAWSAPEDDLKDWRYEGVIYRRTQDPSNADNKLEMWAPDVTLGPDGRYYLYYCLAFHPEIGVAVSDSPAGPFAFHGHVKYQKDIMDGKALNEYLPFDPAVLTDDDGRVYLYYGFSPVKDMAMPDPEALKEKGVTDANLEMIQKLRSITFSPGGMAVELEPDMITMKGEPRVCLPGGKIAEGTGFDGHGFYEASSVRKVGKKYYYVYSSQLSHELCYAVSDSPIDGYQYGGPIVSNGDMGLDGRSTPVYTLGNNHGGMVQVGNDWYIFYHKPTNGTEFSRQGCAEKIEILPDSSIRQVEITSCGLNDGPLTANGNYPAAIACHLTSKTTMTDIDYRNPVMCSQTRIVEEFCGDTEQDHVQLITQITDGTIIGYKYFQFCKTVSMDIVVRGKADGTISVAIDEAFQEKAGVAAIHMHSEEWQTICVPLTIKDGTHAVYLSFSGAGELACKGFRFHAD